MNWISMVFLSTSLVAAQGQEAAADKLKSQPAEIAEHFLEQVGTGHVQEALDALPMCASLRAKTQQLTLLRRQIDTGLSLYGGPLGVEKVKKKEYSPSLVRLVYLMKREEGFLAWNLYFYRAKDLWEVSAVTFLDQPTALE